MQYWGEKREATNCYVKMPMFKKKTTKPHTIANTGSSPEFWNRIFDIPYYVYAYINMIYT